MVKNYSFFAVLANADEWTKIEVFAKAKESWLRKYLELPYGIPTDNEPVRALQTLNVYSNSYRICLAQEFIEEKTNEIPAAQAVLGIMDLHGSIVTSDAMNCQRETAIMCWR